MKDFSQKLAKLPQQSGVYLMKDALGNVIYVGKAKILKNRVSSYFRAFDRHSPKTQTLVTNIADFEYIITSTEVEALILEANLIKKHKPRFNIMLKDDKAYPYIKVTKEKFPRVLKVRAVKKDGATYFGPYSSNYAVNESLDTIQKLFPIRTCNRNMDKKWARACLNFHIKQCCGPCLGIVDPEQYQEYIDEIIAFLSGRQEKLIKILTNKMKNFAERQAFEQAAMVRDQLRALEQLAIKQKVASTKNIDQDIIAARIKEDKACVFIFFVRNGQLIGKEQFIFAEDTIENEAHLLAQFILQFYSGTAYLPKEIVLSAPIAEVDAYAQWLSQKKGRKVKLTVPQKGDKKQLVEMALANADDFLDKYYEEKQQKNKKQIALAEQLAELLGTDKKIERIEAYDISNIMGTFSVASMVVFEKGEKKTSDYRRFKVKTIEGANDYGSMQEVLYRRFKRYIEQKETEKNKHSFARLPDLLLIDGGKGHVHAVIDVLKAFQIDVLVAGMVKDDRHSTSHLYFNGEEHNLKNNRELYRFIYLIQEEVHRFAISYHRSLRDKEMLHSVLDEIKGVGKKRKVALLEHFKTIEKIKIASIDELEQAPTINRQIAENIYQYFH